MQLSTVSEKQAHADRQRIRAGHCSSGRHRKIGAQHLQPQMVWTHSRNLGPSVAGDPPVGLAVLVDATSLQAL